MNKMWVWVGVPAGIGVLLLLIVVMSGESARADGLKIEDIQAGQGKVAKKGDLVTVMYEGKLANGQVFDKSEDTKEKVYRFIVGAGKGFKGWEAGVEGMREGGVRRIVITPPAGKTPRGKGMAQMELQYDIELLRVESTKEAP